MATMSCSEDRADDSEDACPATFALAVEAPTTLRIRNDGAVPIFIPDACPDAKPDGIALDGASLFEPPTLWACEDAAAGDCTTVPQVTCHEGGDYQLSAGNTLDVSWNGLVRVPTKMPVECTEACNGSVVFSTLACGLDVAPAAGPHQIALTFSRGTPSSPRETVTLDVTLPATLLEIVVGP